MSVKIVCESQGPQASATGIGGTMRAATRVVATTARRIFSTMEVLLRTSKAFSWSIRCWDISCEESETRFLNSSFLFCRCNRRCKRERDDAVLRARADHRDDLLP